MLGSLVAVSAITLNIHNSWDYVRNRLLSATIEYEETDGTMVKCTENARDVGEG